MNIILSLLGVYAFIDLIGACVSFIKRKEFLKAFSGIPIELPETGEKIDPTNDLEILQMFAIITRAEIKNKSKVDEKLLNKTKKALETITKIHENKELTKEDENFISTLRKELKQQLKFLARIDFLYIILNILIIIAAIAII